jgi:hypothetical protein
MDLGTVMEDDLATHADDLPLSYMWQLGSDPDPTRPLRTAPVRREEVLLDKGRWQLLTMPLGTWTREERLWFTTDDGVQITRGYMVGDAALWRSVLEELAAEHAAAADRRKSFYEKALREGWGIAPWMTEPMPSLPEPVFDLWRLREYSCYHCGAGYLGPRGRVYVCSDHCGRDRRKTRKRKWRQDNPLLSQQINAARTARRAEARASRVCEHCGVPISADRSTRRFCSDICRVRAHRAASKPKFSGLSPE